MSMMNQNRSSAAVGSWPLRTIDHLQPNGWIPPQRHMMKRSGAKLSAVHVVGLIGSSLIHGTPSQLSAWVHIQIYVLLRKEENIPYT